MKLHALIIGAHPDDAEFAVGGTILRWKAEGRRVGVLDLTRGERGSRGDAETRTKEAEAASELLDLDLRVNFEQPDARLEVTVELRERLALFLREHAPEVVLTHHSEDLHPDHVATAQLVREAWYLAGLAKLLDAPAPATRPRRLYHFPGHLHAEASVVVDVSDVWERKLELLRCYASQLDAPQPATEGAHLLAGGDVLARLETRARSWGQRVGYAFGEPLVHRGPLPAGDLLLPG
jgi:bacillithiol biosynthesis deacetylase BshB1